MKSLLSAIVLFLFCECVFAQVKEMAILDEAARLTLPTEVLSLGGEGTFALRVNQNLWEKDEKLILPLENIPEGFSLSVIGGTTSDNGEFNPTKVDIGKLFEFQIEFGKAENRVTVKGEGEFLIRFPSKNLAEKQFTIFDEILIKKSASTQLMIKSKTKTTLDFQLGLLCIPILPDGIPAATNSSQADSVVDMGSFDRSNYTVRRLALKTSEGTSHVELGRIVLMEGVRYEFEIRDFLPCLQRIGFRFNSKEETSKLGETKIHMFLQTADKLVVINKEMLLADAQSEISNRRFLYFSGQKNLSWKFLKNTSSGSEFVPCATEAYRLQITILEAADQRLESDVVIKN